MLFLAGQSWFMTCIREEEEIWSQLAMNISASFSPGITFFFSTYRKTGLSTDQASGATSATDLCIHLRPVSDRCAVVRHASRRPGNTGRQRQVVPGWCSTTSRRLQLNDLSEIESTAGLWVSTRYVDTCAQPRHARPVLSSSSCTAHEVRLYIQVQHITYNNSYKQESYLNGRAQRHTLRCFYFAPLGRVRRFCFIITDFISLQHGGLQLVAGSWCESEKTYFELVFGRVLIVLLVTVLWNMSTSDMVINFLKVVFCLVSSSTL